MSLDPLTPPGREGGVCLGPEPRCEGELEHNRERNDCHRPHDPCVGFACGGTDRGRCEPMDGQPSCPCFEGFEYETYALYCCPISGGGDPACA